MARKKAPEPELTSSTEASRAMGARIQQARRDAGFRTAQDFAEALAISVWTVHSWEAGKSQPRYDMLAIVAELTDYPASWFLGEDLPDLEAPGADEMEAGVYGVAPYNQAASEALSELITGATKWQVLIRFNAPVVATAEQIGTLREALERMRPQ